MYTTKGHISDKAWRTDYHWIKCIRYVHENINNYLEKTYITEQGFSISELPPLWGVSMIFWGTSKDPVIGVTEEHCKIDI